MTREGVLSRFPYAQFKGLTRAQVELMIDRIAAARASCLREGDYGEDEEQLIDDMLDLLDPSEDDEIHLLHAIQCYFELLYQGGLL